MKKVHLSKLAPLDRDFSANDNGLDSGDYIKFFQSLIINEIINNIFITEIVDAITDYNPLFESFRENRKFSSIST